MLRDIFLGFIKTHILHHAAQEPVYGLALIAQLRRHGYELSAGTLYPVLHKMEKAGYLTREDRLVEGKIRKYYLITGAGKEALREAREKIVELAEEVLEDARGRACDLGRWTGQRASTATARNRRTVTLDSAGGLHYTRDVGEAVRAAEFTFSNLHQQRVRPRWVRGEVVYAMPLGVVYIDPARQKWANECVPGYAVGGPDGRPERVPEQFGIYDSKPGDPNYSPIWRYNYVVVPRDHQANTLRSEQDCLNGGYPIVQADMYTN